MSQPMLPSVAPLLMAVIHPLNAAMVRKYSWKNSINHGNAAIKGVQDFLSSEAANRYWYPIKLVQSVEGNQDFRKRDIDLLVIARVSGSLKTLSVEVKGDTNHHTGNFFLETLSDAARKTPGAFLATTAKWYFYYFLRSKTLYLLPMKTAKPWFLKNLDRFAEKTTSSARKVRTWRTVGRAVPIKAIMNEVPGCLCFTRRSDWVLAEEDV